VPYPRHPRGGMTLIEVIVVLAILGIAAASVGRIGVRQQTHYRDFADRLLSRSRLREGSTLLAAELRSIAPGAGDLYPGEMHDASIAFRSTVGSFVLCTSAPRGATVIDAIDLTPGSDSATLFEPPAVGDSLWLYDAGTTSSGADDRWIPALIDAVSNVTRPCASDTPSTVRQVARLSLTAPLPSPTEPHAPVRTFRRVRYALYASSDNLWYLGFSDCRPIVRAPACSPLQPISGPYEAHRPSSPSRSGLVLTYLDRDGVRTDDPRAVARIDMVLRTRPDAAGRSPSDAIEHQTLVFRNTVP
jgi:prepilin-type N-terminal cleavage/methylation domain-containing protein